ncbi:MAG TPA: VC0807 family protein [Methylomirabilota bacterium]|nr:VC0807 family protein [Methylomirabilota bacterium]
MPDDDLTAAIVRIERQQVSVRGLLLGNGPRFARDALGPVIVFYVLWKTVGLVAGILGATAVTTAAFIWERRHARTGIAASLGFAMALIQAVTGLLSESARWYFAPGVIGNAIVGFGFLGSVVVGRPLAGVFAAESYPFPPQVKASAAFRQVFGRISLVWAIYLLGRGALRLLILFSTSVEAFLVVSIATGFPLSAAIMAWSFWYGVRRLSPAAA